MYRHLQVFCVEASAGCVFVCLPELNLHKYSYSKRSEAAGRRKLVFYHWTLVAEMRTNVGHLFPVCCLTGTLGFLDDRLEERTSAQVSASIRVLAVKWDRCRGKGQEGKKVTFSAPKDRRRQLLSRINLGIIIMHPYVNNSEVKIHFWINSALRASAAFPHERDGGGEEHSIHAPPAERLEYMCAFILPPLVSAKLFMSSRSIQSQCVSWRRPYISLHSFHFNKDLLQLHMITASSV